MAWLYLCQLARVRWHQAHLALLFARYAGRYVVSFAAYAALWRNLREGRWGYARCWAYFAWYTIRSDWRHYRATIIATASPPCR